MSNQTFTLVGLGEIIWDLLPSGPRLGGAPANFAYHSRLLGNNGIVAGRIGADRRGDEAVALLTELGIDTSLIQTDPIHTTGTAAVELDESGAPAFLIAEDVAWDFLELTPSWRELAARADAVCFGSLAQRSEISRQAIHEFLNALRDDAAVIFDVNLRQRFYSAETLERSLEVATIAKMSEEELSILSKLFGVSDEIARDAAEFFLSSHDLEMVCVTRGERGAFLVTKTEALEHPGFEVEVKDTVGAGDAFTAALTYGYLLGENLEKIADRANRLGAWVASQVGAMPLR